MEKTEKIEDPKIVTPVNLTVSVFLKNKLYLEPFSRLLVCSYIPEFEYVQQEGVPFFGKDNVIVGNKSYLWESHGVRCQGKNGSKGAMKNCISLDYQLEGENYNIKIYKEKFHMVGINSLETANKIIDGIIKLIDKTNEIWCGFYSMSALKRRQFIMKNILPLTVIDDKLREYDSEYDNDYLEIIEKNKKHKRLIKEFLKKCMFYENVEELYEALAETCDMTVGQQHIFTVDDSISVKKVTILDGTYMGNINRKDIPLGQTALKLREKGFTVTFQNQKGKFIRIITDTGLENKIIKKTNSRIPLHQINIYDSGHIRVNSPGDINLVVEESSRIISCVVEILDELDFSEDDTDDVVEKMAEILQKVRKSKNV